MYSLESLKIDLASLKEGDTTFSYDLGDDYFEAVGGREVGRGTVHADITVARSGGVYRLGFHTEGVVIVPCDRCLDDMEQEVSADNTLTARIGEEFSEDDDLVTVDPLQAAADVDDAPTQIDVRPFQSAGLLAAQSRAHGAQEPRLQLMAPEPAQ